MAGPLHRVHSHAMHVLSDFGYGTNPARGRGERGEGGGRKGFTRDGQVIVAAGLCKTGGRGERGGGGGEMP